MKKKYYNDSYGYRLFIITFFSKTYKSYDNVADGPVRLLSPSMSPFSVLYGCPEGPCDYDCETASGRDCHVTAGTRGSGQI